MSLETEMLLEQHQQEIENIRAMVRHQGDVHTKTSKNIKIYHKVFETKEGVSVFAFISVKRSLKHTDNLNF